MKTLYMTDLDGTLLTPDQALSTRTVGILNALADAGCLFSICTARSLIGIKLLDLQGVRFTAPMVLMNGAMTYDAIHERVADALEMSPAVAKTVLEIAARHGKSPMVYRVENGGVTCTYTHPTSPGEESFMRQRLARLPELFWQVNEHDSTREAVYFSMQDRRETLTAIRAEVEAQIPEVRCSIYRDNYVQGNFFLEIFDRRAGKDNGALRVKRAVGADRLVAFGDNDNDLPMLRVADLACVVENGVESAKRAADVIVGANDADGVALYLQADWEGR
ncbi:MAG: HAD-IIB family hydrolase [Acutalibacteraceae bacterium]|jgi:Cof subfamily protein (haloacid dehalogenase superfamily)